MTDTSTPTIVLRSQFAGSNEPYEVDVSERATQSWEANSIFNATDFTKPSIGHETGFVYQTSANGQSGTNEPAWPTTLGGTVVDGSLTWTAVAPPAGGEDSIASVTWTQSNPPDGTLTITNQSHTSLTALAYCGGGTAGNTYLIVVAITMTSGAVYVAKIALSIL